MIGLCRVIKPHPEKEQTMEITSHSTAVQMKVLKRKNYINILFYGFPGLGE